MTQPDKLMRDALEFYANPDNWKWVAKSTDTVFILDCGSEVQRDFGAIARNALNPNKDSLPVTEVSADIYQANEAIQPKAGETWVLDGDKSYKHTVRELCEGCKSGGFDSCTCQYTTKTSEG